jgi:hypothetical protein
MKVASFEWFLILVLLPSVAAGRQANTSGGDLRAEIQTVYNFQPHTLTKAQIAQKSELLDQFWTKAKSQSEVYIPGLRRELADFSNPPFFLFDGSMLLMSLSKDPADHKIILAAVAQSDLRDLQLKDYFLLVQSMAAQGEDTTAAAFHILAEPKFQVFIPLHSLTLAQNYCLIYMLLPTSQDLWLKPAVERLHVEKDEAAQKSLLLLLWYAQTSDSDKAITDFSTDASKPSASRTYAAELAHREDSPDMKVGATALLASEESLRKARRERMKAVSDEALYDMDAYTVKIIAKRK